MEEMQFRKDPVYECREHGSHEVLRLSYPGRDDFVLCLACVARMLYSSGQGFLPPTPVAETNIVEV